MRTQTRTQKKEEARIERKIKSKEVFLKSSRKTKRKFSIINVLTLFSIIIVLLTLLVLSKSDVLKLGSFAGADLEKYMLFSNVEDFRNKYDEKLQIDLYEYMYDKTVEKEIKSNTEISLKQRSTNKTNSLIGVYMGNTSQIEKVAVIGVYNKDNNDFPLGLKENCILLVSIIQGIKFKQAEDFLRNKSILDYKGDIILKSSIIEDKDKEYIFYIENNNKFFFSVQAKKPLVEN